MSVYLDLPYLWELLQQVGYLRLTFCNCSAVLVFYRQVSVLELLKVEMRSKRGAYWFIGQEVQPQCQHISLESTALI